jgi:hypothetical protein
MSDVTAYPKHGFPSHARRLRPRQAHLGRMPRLWSFDKTCKNPWFFILSAAEVSARSGVEQEPGRAEEDSR